MIHGIGRWKIAIICAFAAIAAIVTFVYQTQAVSGTESASSSRPTDGEGVSAPPTPAPTLPEIGAAQRPMPHPIVGVTLDRIENLSVTADSLLRMAKRPTVRVMFDRFAGPADYQAAVARLSRVAYTIGVILDSSDLSEVGLAAYKKRVAQYVDVLQSGVDVWEIGNEVNGDWTGETTEVAEKVVAAFDFVKARGLRVSITAYYSDECRTGRENEMFRWLDRRLPPRVKSGLDFVFVSYDEQECGGRTPPDWPEIFKRLGVMFPAAKTGLADIGTNDQRRKAELIRRYYRMRISEPSFTGGVFWRSFHEDMVPVDKPHWKTLNDTIENAVP